MAWHVKSWWCTLISTLCRRVSCKCLSQPG